MLPPCEVTWISDANHGDTESAESDFGPSLRARRSEDALKIRGSRKLIRSWQHDTNQTAGQQRHHPHARTRKCWAARVGTGASGTERTAGRLFAGVKVCAALVTAAVGLAAEVRYELGQPQKLHQDQEHRQPHNKARRTTQPTST